MPPATTDSLVIGATGVVGGFIMEHIARAGRTAYGFARSVPEGPNWIAGNLDELAKLTTPLPRIATVYSTVSMPMLPAALPYLVAAGALRIVAFSTTSILTKANSRIRAEREGLKLLADSEDNLIAACGKHGVAWTILRPTMIYAEGRDVNVTRLANLIRRFGWLPLAGAGGGLRQPVHAEDLAIGAIAAAASPAAVGRTYVLPGAETLTYHEMVGRIFDGLHKPRRIVKVPPLLWRAAFGLASPFFPGANAAMGDRMSVDMVFDASPAVRDFGWNPRPFRPKF